MSALTQNEVIIWHREQANEHRKFTKMHDEIADHLERNKTLSQSAPPPAVPLKPVTISQFEISVRELNGRIKDHAAWLGTSSDALTALIGQSGRIYKDKRGWLKLREN